MTATAPPEGRGEVVFVGTGFSLVTQTTPEALAAMQRADKLFHVVGEPAAAVWMKSLNQTAESLALLYREGKPRRQTYREMVGRILAHVRRGERVCVALYGHPTVGCDPTQMILARGRREGFTVRVLPGISSDACLFADLGVDPMRLGMQAYEATVFVQMRPRIDTRIPIVLWQIGFIGETSIQFSGRANKPGVTALARRLAAYYGSHHRVAIYQASWYPFIPSTVTWTHVRSLPETATAAVATLFVPARRRTPKSRPAGSARPRRGGAQAPPPSVRHPY
jgi:siroheme synthase